MFNVVILNVFLALFGASWRAEATIGTLPSAALVATDSVRLKVLNVRELSLYWTNFSKHYINERGYPPMEEGLAAMKCDNPYVYYVGISTYVDDYPVELYVLTSSEVAYYIETIKPKR